MPRTLKVLGEGRVVLTRQPAAAMCTAAASMCASQIQQDLLEAAAPSCRLVGWASSSSGPGSFRTQLNACGVQGAAEFISRTWHMVNAGETVVGWSPDGRAIRFVHPMSQVAEVLPRFFSRGGQYTSFMRALNAYGFKGGRVALAARTWELCLAHARLAQSFLVKTVARPCCGRMGP